MNTPHARTVLLLGLCLAPISCGGGEDRGDGYGFGSGLTSAGGGETDGNEPDGADPSGDSTGGGPKWDVAGTDLSGPDGDAVDASCEKVDLLFVIDDSQSMEDEQTNLVASFPGFIDTMKAALEGVDYHIGVTTSDAYACNPADCQMPGALVTQTCGAYSSEATCGPFSGGKRFLTGADDLAAGFDCIGRVGTAGSFDERPMQALQQAVDPALNAAGACNDGFMRPDALLVVVLITDEEDDDEFSCNAFPGSGGGPQQWYDTVVQAKGGVPGNVAVLSLIGLPPPDECPTKVCGVQNGSSDAEVSPRLLDFTNQFTHSFKGPVCAPNYDVFFQDAVGVIATACDEFQPPG